ncbi:MAG: hypothetical protein GY772_00820 [bacterium]|nr:hypothetical protein [bacterium]
MALLTAVKTWLGWMRQRAVALTVRADNVATLAMALRCASTNQRLNAIGAEMAAALDEAEVDEVVAAHVPGPLNSLADQLSRLHAPKGEQKAVQAHNLAAFRRTPVPPRDEAFYQRWALTGAH